MRQNTPLPKAVEDLFLGLKPAAAGTKLLIAYV
jgi:hypothetical protein